MISLTLRKINEALIAYLIEYGREVDFLILSQETYMELTKDDIFPLPGGIYRSLLGVPVAITQKELEKGFEFANIIGIREIE